jgi:hypothetical protein
VRAWLFAFLLTQAIEAPLLWRATPGRGSGRRLLVALGASTLTHPPLWFLLSAIPLPYWPRTLLGEAAVVLVEAAWLRAWRVRDPLLWSLLANALSAGVGFLLAGTVGLPR